MRTGLRPLLERKPECTRKAPVMYGWNRLESRWGSLALFALVSALMTAPLSKAVAQEAQWIWTPAHDKDGVPSGAVCHFRKEFSVRDAEAGNVAIAADDHFELYVNGRRVGSGSSTRKLTEFDIGRFLTRGNNIVAVKVSNRGGKTAALAARLTVKDADGQWVSHSSDASWKTNVRPLPLWNTSLYNDRNWDEAQVFGALGQTAPWDRRDEALAQGPPRSEEHTSELQSQSNLVCRLLLEKKKTKKNSKSSAT